jgi:transketolase
MGVAEQNMVGLATGLAESGFIPFVYSIATFVTLRPYEFIRNGPILHQLPVRIVGVGGGMEYGCCGTSHHGLEDIGMMRLQPGITVIAPADHQQAYAAFLATWDLSGPVYYRLGKDDRTTVPGLNGRFELGQAQSIREGKDLLIISMGSVTSEAVAAAEMLKANGITCMVMVLSSLNPAPIIDLINAISQFQVALTVEEHYVVGGIGSLVSEVVSEHKLNCRVIRCGVKHTPKGLTGSQGYLRSVHQLSREALFDTGLRAVKEVKA